MAQIYEQNLWGSKSNFAFYSGNGSHHKEIIEPYLQKVKGFLKSFKTPISVCDLGCGDFNIGKHLVDHTKQYLAVDIVPELIGFNKEQFVKNNLEFSCLDISKDPLPKADCAIVRQVLQHLSNKEVQNIIPQLSQYKYVILTEHLPSLAFIANKDIIAGQGIRLKKKSGLDITKAPFNFKVKKESVWLKTYLNHKKEVITTTLFEL